MMDDGGIPAFNGSRRQRVPDGAAHRSLHQHYPTDPKSPIQTSLIIATLLFTETRRKARGCENVRKMDGSWQTHKSGVMHRERRSRDFMSNSVTPPKILV
jgi:hypothetical protein